ncbi:MAG: FGGY family carbohydrate kinase [Dongiaceae bacterium]
MTGVLALDQGTTGTKAHRLAPDGGFAALAAFEHRQILPQPGWVEHDAAELLEHLRQCLAAAAGPDGPSAIGLANQGETVVAWDRGTGRPLANAIVWQDTRTRDEIERLRAAGAEAETRARAGLPLDPYFSAAKLRWLLDHAAGARDLLRAGRLGLGTSDSFFLDRLVGRYATDVTTASRTSLMSLATGDWDPELCRLFGVPIEVLPPIRPTLAPFGEVAGGPLAGVPVTASAVDQQAALFGHGCHRPGRAKITFGTGAFALAVIGEALPAADRVERAGLLPTVAWQHPGRPPTYALDGGVYHAASAVNWARRLGLFGDFAEIESFAGPSALESGLVFVPALSGLGAPHWDRSAAGLWIGLGQDTGPLELVRAVLEGVALRAAEVVEAMAGIAALEDSVSIDGGLSRNGYFRRFLAAALGRTVVVPATAELTGLGIAAMALVGAGGAAPGDPSLLPASRLRVEPQAALPPALKARFAAARERSRGWR